MGVVIIPGGQNLSDALKQQLQKDLSESPIRKLTSEERTLYGKAASKAVLFLPAFRDAVALMRPFMDATAPTAYTDPYARVGLGYWFFYILSDTQRASVLLHECMHVLNNHFQRAAEVKSLRGNQRVFNLAGDFEINTVLNRVAFVDLKEGQLPDQEPHSFPPMKTMEIYAELLVKDQKEKQDKCEVHGKDAQENKKKQQEKDQAEADKKKKEDAEKEKGDSEDSDDSGDDAGGDQESDQGDGGDQPGDGAGDGDSDGDGDGNGAGEGSGEGNPSDGHQHGKSGPECTCGKDDEGQDGAQKGKGKGQGSGQGQGSGSSQGQGQPGDASEDGDGLWGCGEATEERQDAADDAGIQRASDVEQTIAKANTAARIVDQKNSGGRGTGHMDEFWDSILKHLMPKKVDWRKIFRQVLSQSSEAIVRGRQDYTYRRVSRRLTGGEFVFPGMVNYLPKVTLAIDTSGSMGNEDYERALNEIEGIVKEVAKGKDSLSIFSVDTQVGNVQPVTSVKKIRLHGGGGTQMAVAWKYIKSLPKTKHPDLFVLSTDGYIDWADVEREVLSSKFKAVILVTQKGGFEQAPETLKRRIPILCIDEGKN